MTDQEIRLKFGEMNAGEMRLARALVAWHEREITKLNEELAALRQPTHLAQLRSCDRARTIADLVEARMIRSMEAVPLVELVKVYWDRNEAVDCHTALTRVRARLIAAAKGEEQSVVVNEPPQNERQPDLSGESGKQAQPWTPAVGDTVRLKSGGPAMTVTDIDPLSLMCAWMNADDELQVEPITTLCLEPAKP